MSERDLIIVTLAGVQRFITASRTTTDLTTASRIVAELIQGAAARLQNNVDATVVFPGHGPESHRDAHLGLPNRIVALVSKDRGPDQARCAKEYIVDGWTRMVREVFEDGTSPQPGWPVVQWVSVSGDAADYQRLWANAHLLLADRKNVRDFTQPADTVGDHEDKTELCTVSPQWRSVTRPRKAEHKDHLLHETLSVANWVKRLYLHTGRPSTNGIASAPFRKRVLQRRHEKAVDNQIRDLHDAVGDLIGKTDLPRIKVGLSGIEETPPASLSMFTGLTSPQNWYRTNGSLWSYPATWNTHGLLQRIRRENHLKDLGTVPDIDETCVVLGRHAAVELQKVMATEPEGPDGPPPDKAELSPHLAVLVQDIDSLGRYLSGGGSAQNGETLTATLDNHMDVSRRLSHVAGKQAQAVSDGGGHVVYAGGDDLLALVPAATAVDVAMTCRDAVAADLPTASTGLLFFHHGFPLQRALVRARELLEEAKRRKGKDGLGIGYIRRSGSHSSCVIPWGEHRGEVRNALNVFAAPEHHEVRLSPGLLRDIVGESWQPDQGFLSLPESAARRELLRLIGRHTIVAATGHKREDELRTNFAAGALAAFDRLTPDDRLVSEELIRIAVFLRQESHDDTW